MSVLCLRVQKGPGSIAVLYVVTVSFDAEGVFFLGDHKFSTPRHGSFKAKEPKEKLLELLGGTNLLKYSTGAICVLQTKEVPKLSVP